MAARTSDKCHSSHASAGASRLEPENEAVVMPRRARVGCRDATCRQAIQALVERGAGLL